MNPSAEALAWALVHFIWQGAALALIAFFAMRWLRLPAEGRYIAGILTLALMLASPAVTYLVLARGVAPAPTGPALGGAVADVGAVRTIPSAHAIQASRGAEVGTRCSPREAARARSHTDPNSIS